jgi:NAD(P)-dependent dehydrogenase (short-subunit alcohol dehydrogenase family)
MAGPDFTGKVIAITGGASGIGLSCAKLLSSLGAKISIGDMSEAGLQKTAKEIESSGGEVFTQVIDVRKGATVDAWIKATVEKFGKLDGAANMAGVIGKNHGNMLVSARVEGDGRKELMGGIGRGFRG